MKRAIVTRADSGIQDMIDITHPLIKKYADKCSADFIVLDGKPPVMTDDNHPHYRIMEVDKLYEEYERILVLDTDILISPKCPDLFKVVPTDKVGTIFEDVGSKKVARRQVMKAVQHEFGDVRWYNGYINNGVFITSRMHRKLFQPYMGKYYTAWGSDDAHMGYLIHKYGYEIHELPFQYNHMTMFSEPWNGFADRFESNIIHYAGRGQFNLLKSRLDNIKSDKEELLNAKSYI